jgi:hypothetical protein
MLGVPFVSYNGWLCFFLVLAGKPPCRPCFVRNVRRVRLLDRSFERRLRATSCQRCRVRAPPSEFHVLPTTVPSSVSHAYGVDLVLLLLFELPRSPAGHVTPITAWHLAFVGVGLVPNIALVVVELEHRRRVECERRRIVGISTPPPTSALCPSASTSEFTDWHGWRAWYDDDPDVDADALEPYFPVLFFSRRGSSGSPTGSRL